MRRMNSTFDGHHGASARTSSSYLRIASSASGSRHDNGRCTVRLGTVIASTSGKLTLDLAQHVEQLCRATAPCRHNGSAASGCRASGRSGRRASAPSSACASACTRSRNAMSELHRAIFDQQIVVPGATVHHRDRTVFVAADDRRTELRAPRCSTAGPAMGSSRLHRDEAHGVAAA